MIFLLKAIQKSFYRLPLWALKLCASILAFIFYLNSRKRKIAYRNLKTAFPAKSYLEIMSILRKSYCGFSLSLIESLVPSRFYSSLELTDSHLFKEPGVCVGIHAGSWELANLFFAQKHRFAILAKPQKNKRLDSFLNKTRTKEGMHVCFSLRSLIKYIKDGYHVGLVVDHGAEEGAVFVDFFGQIIPAPKGAALLAKKFKKKIYLFFNQRTGGFKHRLKFLGQIDPLQKSDEEIVSSFSRIYQEQLIKHPREYFWWHKRFKNKKNRQVLVLSDGKAGHIKQSEALLSILKRKEGYIINEKVVTVKYRNYFMRVAANFIASLCPSFAPFSVKLLRLLLDKESYKKLAFLFSDIVISTGNFTAPIAKILASSLGAKSVAILRTNLSPSRFDLAIIPEHDRLYAGRITKIKGALAYPERSEEKKERCKAFFKLGEKKKASFFLGGPVFDSDEFNKKLKFFIKQLKKFSLDKKYKLLISTSRRTPPEAVKYIKQELEGFQNTEALVIAGESNLDFVFEGFVLLSDLVFCSSESISMITEIASLGKPCVCVSLETEDDKRKVFLNSMRRELNFLSYPFNVKNESLKVSDIFSQNLKIIEKASDKLFFL